MAQQFEVQALGLNGIPYRIEIYNSNYSGTTVTQLDGDQQFIRFEGGQRERVGIEPIWGKEVRINVRTNEDLSPLFGLEDRDAEVRVFRTDTSSLVWKGFILTDFFQDEPLTDLPGVELRAVDGLTTLEGDSFDALSGVSDSDIGEDGSFISYTDLFTGVLSTLYDSPLDVEFAVEWYPDAGGQLTSSDNPLRFSGARPDVFYDSEDGEWFNQQSALEDALKSQGLEVRQSVIGGELTWLVAQPTALSVSSVKTWRYAPGGTEDTSSPFTRDLSLDLSTADTNRPTREFERRSGSVSVTHDHTEIDQLVSNPSFENAVGQNWTLKSGSNFDSSVISHSNAGLTPSPVSQDQDTLEVEQTSQVSSSSIVVAAEQNLGEVSEFPDGTSATLSFRSAANITGSQRIAISVNNNFHLKNFFTGLRQETLAGETEILVDEIKRDIPVGATLPIVDQNAPPGDAHKASITLSERAESGTGKLVGQVSEKVTDTSLDVLYAGFVSNADEVFIPLWKPEERFILTQIRFAWQDSSGNVLSGDVDLELRHSLSTSSSGGPAYWDNIGLELTENQNPISSTTTRASAPANGKERAVSVLLSSGPTSENPRRVKGLAPGGFSYQAVDWGIGAGGGSLSLAGLQARERLRYLREHLERQQLTVYARDKSPVVTGEEIVQFDGKTWRIAEFSSDPASGEIGLTLIQHADAGTTDLSIETVRDTDGGGAAGGGGTTPAVGGGGGGTGIEVIQLDASGGNVTETLPTPSSGATALALRVDTSTSNTATLDTPGSQEIRFAEGKNVSSTTLGVEQSLLLSSDGNNWYVEEGQGLSAEAEAVTTDAATKDSPSLTQTATYDSDGTTSVTSSDVSIERYVRTDNNGNATLVYESGGTEIARLTDAGRFETRADMEAFADGSFGSGSSTNSLLQVEDGQGDVLTTDAASLQFTGSGISLTKSGDEITIDVSGGSGSDIDIEQNQTPVVGGATGVSFEGSGIDSVSNDGDGTATVSISKGSSTEIQEGGTAKVSDATVLDFAAGDFSVANPTSGEAEVSLQDDTVTVAGNSVPLGGSTGIAHGDLSSIGSSDHHTKTTSAADLTDVSADSVTDAHHTRPSAGDGLSDSSNTFSVNESQVDHDSLNQYVANEHVDHSAVTISAGTALSGGGDLTASRTLNVSGPLTGIPFKTSGDSLEWQVDANNDLILQNTTHVSNSTTPQTLLKVDQDTGTVFAAGDVVAFGLSGGGGTGSTSGLQADAPLTLDTTTSPDTIGLSVGSGLTVTNGALEADGSVGVSSVFGRTGDVTASSGDYSASQISNFDSAAVDALKAHDGTGVDADTLDGVEGSSYTRSDQSDTINGQYQFNTTGEAAQFGDGSFSNTYLTIRDTPDNFGAAIGLDTTRNVGGSTGVFVWHANKAITFAPEEGGSFGASPEVAFSSSGAGFGGETAPSYAVDVNGDINFTGDLRRAGGLLDAASLSGASGTSGQVLQSNGVSASWVTLSASSINNFDETAQDAVDSLLIGGAGIDLSYDDFNDELTITSTVTNTDTQTDLENAAGVVVPDADAMAFQAGANSSVTVADDTDGTGTITISSTDTDTQLSDSEVQTAIENATGDVAISISGDADTLDGVQLSNINFADIAATRYRDEEAQDAVGTIISGSGAASVTYDDANNTITVSATDTNTNTQTDLESSGGTVVSDANAMSFEAGANSSVTVSNDNDGTGTVTISSTDTDTQLTDSEVKTAIENATSDVAIDISGDADTLDGVEGSSYAQTNLTTESFSGNLVVGGGSQKDVLTIADNTASFGAKVGIRWVDPTASDFGGRLYFDDTNSIMRFVGVSSGSEVDAWAVDRDNGQVGIGGNINPSYALEIFGDARASGEVEAFLGSDRRLKTGLDPLDSALDKVDHLTGYGFDWRDQGAVQPHKRGKADVGLIAQEVEGVLPEAVKTFTDGHSEGYKSVSYDKLVPLLVEAIKDLRSQVNNLQ